MLKRTIILCSALLFLSAGAVLAASANFNVSITIRQPIVVTCPATTGDLIFGTVEAVPSTVYTINAVSGTQLTNGHAANCTVQGESGLTPTVTVPASTVVTGPGTPATDITVTLTPQATAAFTGGTDNFFIGGSFTIPAGGQPSGTYTGTSTLTVIY